MQPILTVDLTNGSADEFEIQSDWKEKFLGGASLAARILYDKLTPELDPLSSEAPLLFMTGPLTGTSGPTVGRFVVCGKSPATGLWGESNCGGFWGVELRKNGYDGLLITGRAETPVSLSIIGGKVTIIDCADYWGLDTDEIQTAIEENLDIGKVSIARIGIAGEHMIPSASIVCDNRRVAGRTGMGAIMGSKNLKAIALKGTQEIPISNPKEYKIIRSKANKALKNDLSSRAMREFGTAVFSDYFDYLGEMPKRGFARGYMDGVEKISGSSISETILTGVSACHACVVACGRVVQLDGKAEKQKGPEYETLVGFGPNLWVDDPEFVTNMNELCDLYGMDTLSVSNTIGFSFTLFEKGIISDEDTSGIKLTWGNTEVIEKLVHLIATREGFGEYLAEGARALGKRYGVEELAVQVNGLEVPYHDPRGGSGTALVYATSPRGACHNQSDYYIVDIGQAEEELGLEMFSRHGGAEKAANVSRHQDWRTITNDLVMCILTNLPSETLVELINAGCGLDWKLEDVFKAGERGWNLKRAINNRLGLRRENDKLPKTLLEPLPDGGSEGFVIDFQSMLKAYYLARDWDWETGFPTREKLESLELEWVADDLWPKN